MRLLETAPAKIPSLRMFAHSQTPPYAILSHTWEDGEVTLQQLQQLSGAADSEPLAAGPGLRKIQKTCELARARDGLQYAWVDTCCIDKTSSAELTEAINSMFAWYRDASVCYVFLSDLEPGTDEDLLSDLPKCRWFTRGWTLQELIAPRDVLFFDKAWNYRGSKRNLAALISFASGIPEELLRYEADICDFSVACRMSWAAKRETTRVEDMAYCLLGIFDVNMSLIYGEGDKAFARLQAAIVQTTPDLSIFVWTDDRRPCPQFSGVLAKSPRDFASCGAIRHARGDSAYASFSVTTRGIQSDAGMLLLLESSERRSVVVLGTLSYSGGNMHGVRLRKVGGGLYVRCRPDVRFSMYGDLAYQEPLPDNPEDNRPAKVGQKMVEKLTLAISLPTRFPFHPGPDPAVGYRCSALRVNWGPLIVQEALPRSHCDFEDGVFFSCHSISKGWCAYFVRGFVPVNGNPDPEMRVRLRLFLGCFQWTHGNPRVVLASLDRVDWGARVLLRSHLDHIKFESCEQAYDLVSDVFEDCLKLEQPIPLGDRCLVKYSRTQGPWSEQHPGVRVMLDIRKAHQPDVCVNPVTVLNITCDIP